MGDETQISRGDVNRPALRPGPNGGNLASDGLGANLVVRFAKRLGRGANRETKAASQYESPFPVESNGVCRGRRVPRNTPWAVESATQVKPWKTSPAPADPLDVRQLRHPGKGRRRHHAHLLPAERRHLHSAEHLPRFL